MFKKRLPLIIAGVAFLLLQNLAIGASLTPLPEDVELAYDDSDQPESDLIDGFSISPDGEPDWYDVDLQEYNITVQEEFYVGIEGVEEELAPKSVTDVNCSPNPFSQSTTISYALPQAGRVTVSIWDASGRCVRILIDANEAGGNHSVQWDGADNAGNHLPTGVYFLKLDTNQSTLTRKVVLVR